MTQQEKPSCGKAPREQTVRKIKLKLVAISFGGVIEAYLIGERFCASMLNRTGY
jgi:hypothetical protein